MAFWGRFWAFWSPPMAISDPKNGSYTSARMFPAEIQPWSTQYNQFGATRGAYGRIYPIYGILRPIWGILEPPYGNFRSEKWFLHIGPDVSCWDPTLIHAVQPIWSHQGGLWPDIPHLWHFEAVFGHKNSPKDKKKVGSSWISIYLNHRDHLRPLVHFINTLFLDPPP